MTQVAIEDAIWALQEHWGDVTARLDAGSREELGRMLDDLDGPDRPRAMARIADLLVEGLPREHPVRRALVGGTLLAPGVLDWPAVTRALRGLSAATSPSLLGARADPLGVADWWLSRNGWLGDAPYRLIGEIPDDLLLQAARAVTAEV